MRFKKYIIALTLGLNTVTLLSAQNSSQPIHIQSQYDVEIKALKAHPTVIAAFKKIEALDKQAIKDLITLTQIPAPPFKEEKRAAKFKQMLAAAGVDSIWTDKAGNVIALRKGKNRKRTVVIEGHLDTVFPEGTDVTVKQRGDTLFAPGIGDDTRGLTVVLTLLRAMNQTKMQTDADILFIGTTGEEGLGDLRGVKELFSGKLKIDSYISVDGIELGEVVYGAVGSRRYKITYKGEGGHSYGAFGLANPHNATARAINYFIQRADSLTKSGPKTTYSIGKLGGGTSVNAIPFESWMEVDMRSEDARSLQVIDSLFNASLAFALREENKMKRLGKDLTVDIKLVGDRPSGKQSGSLAILQRASAAAVNMGGTLHAEINSTNANIPISKGVPAVTIWAGGKGDNAHSLHEWWMNDKGHIGIQAALLVLIAEAGLAK
jgi:tripeptide aminopeptidase